MRVQLLVTITVDDTKIKASGPVERLDDNVTPDIPFICQRRIDDAFRWVEGIDDVDIRQGAWTPS